MLLQSRKTRYHQKMKEKTYAVARSDDVDVDVSKILEAVGGGGHPQAASAVISGLDFSEIENLDKGDVVRLQIRWQNRAGNNSDNLVFLQIPNK